MSWQMTEAQKEEARQRELRNDLFNEMDAAVKSNDLKKIEENINQILAYEFGETFCSFAVMYGHSSIVQFFLKHNVKLTSKEYLKETLKQATSKGYRKLTKFLLEAGAVMDSLSDSAGNNIKLETLLDCGVKNFRLTNQGNNILTGSIWGFGLRSRTSLSMLKYLHYHNDRCTSTRLLLKQGADLDKGTETPLELVKKRTAPTKSGEQETLRKLFLPYSLIIAAEDLFTIIDMRAKDPTNPKNPDINKFKEILKFLEQGLQGRMAGNTALHLAVQKRDRECVSLLLSAGANVDILNDQEKSPLHCAFELGDPYILSLCYLYHLRAKQDLAQQQENVFYDEKEEQELKVISEVLAEIKKREALTNEKENGATQVENSQSVIINKADSKESAEQQKFVLTNEELYQWIDKLNEKEKNECDAKLAHILANRNCIGIEFDPLKAYELLTHANTLSEQTEEDFKLANRALYRLLMLNDIKFDFEQTASNKDSKHKQDKIKENAKSSSNERIANATNNRDLADVKSLDEADNILTSNVSNVSNASNVDHTQKKVTVQRGTGDPNKLSDNKELMRLRLRHLLEYAMHGGLQDEVSIGILLGQFMQVTSVAGHFPDISKKLAKQKPYQIIPNLLLILADQCRYNNECAENTVLARQKGNDSPVATTITDAPKELIVTQYENLVNSNSGNNTKIATAANTLNVTRKNS